MAIKALVDAIASIDADLQPVGLTSKPNVKDVEAVAGINATASERDEAWAEFTASASSSETSGPLMIKNGYQSPIEIKGVIIPVGESRPVPHFDPDNSVIKHWIDKGVIQLS